MVDKLLSQRENELIKQVQAGDNNAFGQLYDTYIRKIYDFIYYKTLNKETAEDITSQVFIKALKNISKYKENSFQAWLYTIARNTVTDYYRAKKDNLDIDDVWDLASKHDLYNELDVNLQLEKVYLAMSKLKSTERDLLIKRLWQGLSYDEIAVESGKSVASVKMAVSRSLTKIKAEVPLVSWLLFPLVTKIWIK